MKIAIFISSYYELFYYKEVGQIANGFTDLGHQVVFYVFKKQGEPPWLMKVIDKKQAEDASYWQEQDFDLILFYSYLSVLRAKIIKALKTAQKFVILKLDSDGHLFFPYWPTYFRGFGHWISFSDFLIYWLRILEWFILGPWLCFNKISQIKKADYIILESPLARENLIKTLKWWHQGKELKKIKFIPDPVDDDFLKQPLFKQKNKIVLMVGRWSSRAKNFSSGWRALKKFLGLRPDYSAIIIGSLPRYFRLKGFSERVMFLNQVPRPDLKGYYQAANIIFMPCFWESFCLAAAEALVFGCTLAGPALEPFIYFIKDGFSGTLAEGFKPEPLEKALIKEAAKWEQNKYQFPEIASYWRKELARRKIAQQIINLFLEK